MYLGPTKQEDVPFKYFQFNVRSQVISF